MCLYMSAERECVCIILAKLLVRYTARVWSSQILSWLCNSLSEYQ